MTRTSILFSALIAVVACNSGRKASSPAGDSVAVDAAPVEAAPVEAAPVEAAPDKAAPDQASASAKELGSSHACPTLSSAKLGRASVPVPLVEVFSGIPGARVLDRRYEERLHGVGPIDGSGMRAHAWTVGTLDPKSGDPPPGGLTLDAARERLASAAKGREIVETGADNRPELVVELPAAAAYRAFLSVTSFIGSVRTVTFTCLELRPELHNPTVGELQAMGALPVELPEGFAEALGAKARVRMLKAGFGLAMSLESDRARPARVAEALEAAGFRRVGKPPSWRFEREQDGTRQSAAIAGNGSTLSLHMGGLHWTFSYQG